MIQLDLNPDSKKLRQFGWVCLVGFGVIGLFIARRTGAFEENGTISIVPLVLFGLAIVCPILGMISSVLLKPIYVLLTLIAFPIGLIVSNTILVLFYILIITPIALFFRIIGRDELNLKPATKRPSYWEDAEGSSDMKRYYKQF
jgi:hypothetical protein